jgi:CBS domain-containing protein
VRFSLHQTNFLGSWDDDLSTKKSISQIMVKNVLSTEASASLVDAVRLIAEKGIGCLVITEDGKPVGILTERDIMKEIVNDKNAFQKDVGSLMRQPLISVSPDTEVVDALDLMRKKDIRRLPVVNKGRLEGIVTVHRDLLYWALAAMRPSSATPTVPPDDGMRATD